MAYIGKTPSQATRARYYYTATGGETSLSGADDNGNTLVFSDGNYVDVMLNGVTLVAGTDYNTTTANTIGGLTALTADDVVEIVVYDTFSVFGGDVKGDFTITNGQLGVTDITANDSNGIQFNTDEGTQRAVIDDSGNLLVGKTSTDSNVEGSVLYNDSSVGAMASFCSDGIRTIIANRKTSDGQIIDFRKDGSTVGSIGTVGGDPYMTDGTVGYRIYNSNSIIPSNSTGGGSNGVVDLGGNGLAFKDLYLSGGVYLGGTGAANYLDDCEEGTWTPTITGTSSGTSSGGSRAGVYTKIGRTVFVSISCTNINKNTINGVVRVSLPFTVQDNLNSSGTCRYGGFATASGTVTVIPQIGNGASYLELQMFDKDDFISAVSDSNLDTTFQLYNITYIFNT